MAVVKRNDLTSRSRMQELTDLRQRMFQLFEDPFSLPLFREPGGWTPDVDITESDGQILVKAELPGMSREDVEIDVDGDMLTLKGEKKEEKEEKEKDHYLYECNYGSFRRSFTLPSAVDENGATAEFKDGILRITLPKRAGARGRKIEIRS